MAIPFCPPFFLYTRYYTCYTEESGRSAVTAPAMNTATLF
jgi:hypothetical protein